MEEEEDKEEARVVEEGGEVAKGHMPTILVAATTTIPRREGEEGVDHSLMGNIEDEEGGTRHT